MSKFPAPLVIVHLIPSAQPISIAAGVTGLVGHAGFTASLKVEYLAHDSFSSDTEGGGGRGIQWVGCVDGSPSSLTAQQ